MQHKSNDCHTGTLKGWWRGEREEKVEGGGTGAGGWPISQSAGSYITTTRTRRSRHRCVLGVRRRDQLKWQMTPMRIPIIIGIVIIIIISVCFRLHSSGTGHAQVISAL